MNSLRLESISSKLISFSPVASLLDGLSLREFDINCASLETPFLAMILSYAISHQKTEKKSKYLVITPSDQEANDFANDCIACGVEAMVFPWWETAAYRPVEQRSSAFGKRAAALSSIIDENGPQVIIACQRAMMTPVPKKEFFCNGVFRINKGDSIKPELVADKLTKWGYLRVPRVSLPGEFAQRGEVFDIFMPGEEDAYRLVLDFDCVEEIRRFEPVSQASDPIKPKTVLLRPARELVWTKELAELAGAELAKCPVPKDEDRSKEIAGIVEALITKGDCKGEELLFPLIYGNDSSLVQYFGENDICVFIEGERLSGQADAIMREYQGLYRKTMLDQVCPPPSKILVDYNIVRTSSKRTISTWSLKSDKNNERIDFKTESPRSFFGNVNYFRDELDSLLKSKYSIHVFAENVVQAERISSLLGNENVTVYSEGLSAGFSIPELKLSFVHQSEIFGRRKHTPKSLKNTRSKVIDTFVELNPGDYVVHVNYGIGRFSGIERVKVLGNDRDYIKIEYAEEENVFVPIEQSNLVQRYIGNEGDAPHLDRLGSKSWENRKNKVKKSVEDLAERLIRIYSRRKMARGFAFPPDGEWQTMFEAAFPYEETPDQLQCISDVKKDMESERPMDRLVCGDVGYGKTEIAMRAAFKAVMGGKQVAFLAPTTILAEQHYENFKERFRGLPVKFSLMSRFVDKKEIKSTLQKLSTGAVDVLIGTHRILQKDVQFKDLGLLMVDEEQRFGVKDKERLKEMKANVDCLTLTATPIPRTLHMSMLKIRDLSILSTPPNNRHPIQTIVDEYAPDLIAKAIRHEIERDGQVFFLHNRVQSLEETANYIQQLVPEVLIETAHGKMDAKELEDKMHRFIHHGFHVLVSTTIIENGIDIPNVNTIIIDRADMYGISQLYQLRGRVGRSDRKAYAYLFYPDGRALSELAMKRLQIISDFTDLGSGFKVAMKDMEVRGAGNLLGREQSGDIMSVGFDLYLKLLDDAVARLSNDGYSQEAEPYLELEYSGYIPNEYISQQTIKMEIYKKIASILIQEELDSLYRELEDRFGPIPEEVSSLLALAEIRIICKKLSVATLKERKGFVTIEFAKVSKISVERLVRMMKESGQKIKLDPSRPNILMIATGPIGLKEKSEFIREKLATLLG